ncbi:MAG: alpha-N-arabinofuranosidase [Clostridia bacterium]|nr:alpha-N-arabinofuranosidase [Clostridia bacterium]
MDRLILHADLPKGRIRKGIQGQFSEHLGRCIYGGLYVGEQSEIPNVNGIRQDVVQALREIRIPVLRWPGGCFADEYHWKDGIGPKETRKKMINTHWGGVTEDNSFGTHEFMELCRQLGCDAYICGNVGSGTVQEMSEWVEYMTSDAISPMTELRKQNGRQEPWRLPFFGVGNESWGCGGNMTPEYYANEYRRYQTFVRQYRPEEKIYKIACGPSDFNYEWTEVLMRNAGRYMDGLSLHYYTVPHEWSKKGSALDFTAEDYYTTIQKTLRMEEIITRHSAIMDQYDPEKRVGLIVDEWGTWYDVEEGTNPGFLYQQNTMRDAIVAGLNLNIFNRHCDRVHMANIAQMINVLQAMILTEGPAMIKTPSYYAFKLFCGHQENQLLESHMLSLPHHTAQGDLPGLQESASLAADGTVHVTIVNPALDEAREVKIDVLGKAVQAVGGEILTGAMDDHNSFDRPDAVADRPYTDFATAQDGLTAKIPPCSIVHLTIR